MSKNRELPPKFRNICPVCFLGYTTDRENQVLCSTKCRDKWNVMTPEEREKNKETVAEMQNAQQTPEEPVCEREARTDRDEAQVESEHQVSSTDTLPAREITWDAPKIDWGEPPDRVDLLKVDPDIEKNLHARGMALRWADTGEVYAEKGKGTIERRKLDGWTIVHASEKEKIDPEGGHPIDSTIRRRELILCTQPQERVDIRNAKVREGGAARLRKIQEEVEQAKDEYKHAVRKAKGTSKIISIPKTLGKNAE